jgi:nucleoside 2-deoxyribosyltransferase
MSGKTAAKIYLAHPYSKRLEAKRIQTEIEKLGVQVINPFERGEQKIYEKKLGPGGPGLSAKDCAQIVQMDLAKIDQSDFVVALLLDPEYTLGTYMEILYTGEVENKKVIAYTPVKRLAKHPWIRYYCNVTKNEEKLYDTIRSVASHSKRSK